MENELKAGIQMGANVALFFSGAIQCVVMFVFFRRSKLKLPLMTREQEVKAGIEIGAKELLALAVCALCIVVFRPLGNYLANVAANPITEIGFWFMFYLTIPLIVWSALFVGSSSLLSRIYRYQTTTFQVLALLWLCSMYISGTSTFIATTTQYQFTIASLEMNAALFGAFLAYLVLPCIYLFIWKIVN